MQTTPREPEAARSASTSRWGIPAGSGVGGRSLPPSGVVLLGIFAAGADNYVVPPMLLAIGLAFDRSIGQVATTVAVYALAYGAMQLVWGYLSSKLGRLVVIRIGLVAGGCATLAAAFSGDFVVLIVLRALAGAAIAAVYPASITYVGDNVSLARRPAALGELVAAYSAGVAFGIVVGGVAADLASWRVGFAASAVLCIATAGLQLVYGRDQTASARSVREYVGSIGRAAAATWPRVVVLLTLLQGATLYGFLTFFPAALEDNGLSRRLAGLVVALYGIATVLAMHPARRLAQRLAPGRAMALGVLLAAVALVLAASSQTPAAVGVAAVVLAAGTALVHPLLQAWVTVAMPSERATVVSMFATSLYVGTAITAQLAAPFLSRIGYGWTFAVGAVLTTCLAGLFAIGRTRFERAAPPAP